MEKAKIDRINELARLSKTRELTEKETKEQKDLREEYLAMKEKRDAENKHPFLKS